MTICIHNVYKVDYRRAAAPKKRETELKVEAEGKGDRDTVNQERIKKETQK